MFCDYAVEPWYYERGCNFYEDGQNYGMASLLATAGPTLLGMPEFEAMLAAFQRATTEKTRAALTDLVTTARQPKWEAFSDDTGPPSQYAAPECLQAIAPEGRQTAEIDNAARGERG